MVRVNCMQNVHGLRKKYISQLSVSLAMAILRTKRMSHPKSGCCVLHFVLYGIQLHI